MVKKLSKDPEFTQKYMDAFIILMLHKLGGFQAIPLEQLDAFPDGQHPVHGWNEEKQCFVLAAPENTAPPVETVEIVTPSRKLVLPN